MNVSVSSQEGFWDQVKTGMVVGFGFFLLFGLLNALGVMGSTAAWFKQFIQGGGSRPGRRTTCSNSRRSSPSQRCPTDCWGS